MNEHDNMIVESTAAHWIENGGDEDGFVWLYQAIKDRIREMTSSTGE